MSDFSSTSSSSAPLSATSSALTAAAETLERLNALGGEQCPLGDGPSGEMPPDAAGIAANKEVWTPDGDALARWDVCLRALWSPSLSIALAAAGDLFASDTLRDEGGGQRTATPGRVESHVCAEFWRLLTSRQTRVPQSALARYQCVAVTLWRLLRTMRQSPTAPFVEEHLAVAMRAVRALHAGMLTPEVCAALYDFHRGLWTPHLSKPQLWILRTALAQTLAALPPDTLGPFWDGLQSTDSMMQRAMTQGLDFLRAAHAVPHLLVGLEQTREHVTRVAIVECLEQIGDPHALPVLARVRRETAASDWTLSRLIARTIRVIEQQNPGAQVRILLRPSNTPPDYDDLLLRPAPDAPPDTQTPPDRAALLRPANSTEEGLS